LARRAGGNVTEQAAGHEQAAGLAERIDAALARLGEQDLDEHPEAYEAMDADIRAALRALDQA
jgi:hypothetical protein